jgi:hypothetical protein
MNVEPLQHHVLKCWMLEALSVAQKYLAKSRKRQQKPRSVKTRRQSDPDRFPWTQNTCIAQPQAGGDSSLNFPHGGIFTWVRVNLPQKGLIL